MYQVFIDSLKAPWRPFVVFDRLSRYPAPPWPALWLNWWIWDFFTELLLAAWRASAGRWAVPSSILGYSLDVGICAALALASAIIGAVVLHTIFVLCKGTGGFPRSVQIGSTLALINPVSASLRILGFRWAAVALAGFAVFLFVLASERLHKTPFLRGRLIWGLVALIIGHLVFFSGWRRNGAAADQSVRSAEVPQAGKHRGTRSGPGRGSGTELKAP